MLSRSAEGLYWTGRYLERAEHLCRLVAHQIDALEERSIGAIDRRWQRLYQSIGRSPVGGLDANPDDDAFMLADAYTLADDLTFESGNAGSVRHCIAAARENLRQIRNDVSREMWSDLNGIHLDLRTANLSDVWHAQGREFFTRLEGAIRAFNGTVDSTLYRGEGWSFLQTGRFVERAQLLTALLETQIRLYPPAEPDMESDWESLLGICLARAAFRRQHSMDCSPERVIDFLATDARLAHSVRFSLDQTERGLRAIGDISAPVPRAAMAHHRVSRMVARLAFDWPVWQAGADEAVRAALAEIGAGCRVLHADIESAYFHYAIEDAPHP